MYVLNRPVCDDNWTKENARVICKAITSSSKTVGIPFKESFFGKPAFADFILDDVKCRGYESSIGECDYVTVDNCEDHELAGVRCIDPTTLELRGGKNYNNMIIVC